MRKENPACYECPKSENTLHSWYLLNNGIQAKCGHCGLILNEADTLDVYEYPFTESKF